MAPPAGLRSPRDAGVTSWRPPNRDVRSRSDPRRRPGGVSATRGLRFGRIVSVESWRGILLPGKRCPLPSLGSMPGPSAGQGMQPERAETRLLIPSPDRRHWLHHCQNNVRHAVREGVLDPRGVDPVRRFLNASRLHGAVAIAQRQLIFGL